MPLTIEQLRDYRNEGYLLFPGLIQGARLARYTAILDDLVQRAASMDTSRDGFNLQPDVDGKLLPGRLFKVQGVCVTEPRLLELAREPEIIGRVSALIGPSLHMFGSKFFPMLPHGGTSTGWHQDSFYFGTNSERIVSCGIYLEAADRSNGCLRLLPGSHSTGELVEHTEGEGTFAHGNWTQVDESQTVLVECPAGTVVLFSANTLHGATTNTSERSRYSTAWHYLPADLDLESFRFGVYADRHRVTTT